MKTTQQKHTATPWFQKPTAGHETHGQSAIYSDTGSTIAVVYDGDANAQFIVRACNAHDGLVEALEFVLKHQQLRLSKRNGGELPWQLVEAINSALAKATSEGEV